MTRIVLSLSVLLPLACAAPRPPDPAPADPAYEGVQRRGAQVMGVDQYTSIHVFEDLPDGGRIIFTRQDTTDLAGTATIRAHLRAIADSFGRGNFSDPSEVHARVVPGTATMAERRDHIRYAVQDRAGGGELRISTTDGTAVSAIHEFLAFQRMDHHAAGHEGMDHSAMHPQEQKP